MTQNEMGALIFAGIIILGIIAMGIIFVGTTIYRQKKVEKVYRKHKDLQKANAIHLIFIQNQLQPGVAWL